MPERIAGFDGPLFERLREGCRGRTAALVEVAGRDSMAAVLRASAGGSYQVLIPTVVYTGTEHGDRQAVIANARSLSENPAVTGRATVLETVVLGSPAWWNASASRYSSELHLRYGFNATCVACHMYLHAARVPLALSVGARAVISGERLSHDGRIKINQLEPALAAYRETCEGEGLELALPLERTEAGSEIDGIIGPGWPESRRQMCCVLADNYRDLSGGIIGREEDIAAYLDEFLVPFTRRVLLAFREEAKPPDYRAIAGRVMLERGT